MRPAGERNVMAAIGPILGKLKALVRPLLDRVLRR